VGDVGGSAAHFGDGPTIDSSQSDTFEAVKHRILIVDDEPAISENIQFVLETEGLETVRVATGLAAWPVLDESRVDLIILDIGLPDINGLDLLKEIRRTRAMPVILLTARTAEIDRVLGLEIGADDYVAKPFSPRELAARVKAVLRRSQPAPAVRLPGETFVVNTSKRAISFYGTVLELSKYEYEILRRLIERKGHVFSREQLMNLVWDQPETSLDRTVDAHIKNLRAKLRAVRPDLEPIVTHRGSGYSLRDDL
jgi:two-component system catabolic regulation response regulator CreB